MAVPVAPVAHAPAPASYHVQWGDTLSQVALEFYGSASDYPEIQAANPQIQDPDLIYAGDTLKIPAAGSRPARLHANSLPVVKGYTPKHAAYTPRHAAPSAAPLAVMHAAPAGNITVASGNMAQIARYLMEHGATKSAAAGIAACVWGESLGNPESVGSGGFGLIGWTGNTTGLPAGYFGPTGNVPADMLAQLEGVVGYVNANGGFGPINAAGGPVAAAKVFSSKYERPRDLYSDIHYGVAGDPNVIFNAI